MRTCYTVSSPAMINICKGVYTNKTSLYTVISGLAEQVTGEVFFQGAIGYEKKKFNYNNLQVLLKGILVNESFAVKIKFTDDNMQTKAIILEITRHKFNSLNFII